MNTSPRMWRAVQYARSLDCPRIVGSQELLAPPALLRRHRSGRQRGPLGRRMRNTSRSRCRPSAEKNASQGCAGQTLDACGQNAPRFRCGLVADSAAIVGTAPPNASQSSHRIVCAAVAPAMPRSGDDRNKSPGSRPRNTRRTIVVLCRHTTIGALDNPPAYFMSSSDLARTGH